MQLVRDDRRTRLVHAVFVAFVVAILALVAAPASRAADCADADALPSAIGAPRALAAVDCLTTTYRQSQGLPGLTVDAQLNGAAQAHADDMAARGYYEHTTPDGVTFSARLTNYGVSWSAAGEYIAEQTTTPRQVVDAWIASPDHHANLVSAGYSATGLGIASTPDATFWVQEFIQPASSAAQTEAATSSPVVAPSSRKGKTSSSTDEDDGLAVAARALAAKARASASRAGRTLRLSVAVPSQRSTRTRLTIRVTQRGRTVRTFSTVRDTGRSVRLHVRLPRAVAGRAVVTIGTAMTAATFR
jgi:uncharacterized protein YkwD